MAKRVSAGQLESIEKNLAQKVDILQAEVNARLESFGRKLQVLEALEKKMAVAVMELLASKDTESVEGYDIQTIHTSTGPRWVWKHFLRGARSKKSFETREACVKSAKQDSLDQLAFPTKDLTTMITQTPKGRVDGNRIKQRPQPPLVTPEELRPPGIYKSPKRI